MVTFLKCNLYVSCRLPSNEEAAEEEELETIAQGWQRLYKKRTLK